MTSAVDRSTNLIIGALGGLALAVALRVRVAGVAGAASAPAGVLFGLVLLAVAAACGLHRPALQWRQLAWGVGGAALLCLPAALVRLGRAGTILPPGEYAKWATIVALVAVAEELVLRGVLYHALLTRFDEGAAIAVTTVAFALLHVPVYGWHTLLINLAAGYLLGVLRAASGSVTAPAAAHTLADLAGWWLR